MSEKTAMNENEYENEANIVILQKSIISFLFFKYLLEHYAIDVNRWMQTTNDKYEEDYHYYLKLTKNNYFEYFTFDDEEFFKNNCENIIEYDEKCLETDEEFIEFLFSKFITSPLTDFCTSYIKYILTDQYLQLKKGDIVKICAFKNIGYGMMFWDGEKICNCYKDNPHNLNPIVPNIFMLSPENDFTPTYWRKHINPNNFFVCVEYLQQIYDTLEYSKTCIYNPNVLHEFEKIVELQSWKGYFIHSGVKYTVLLLKQNDVFHVTKESIKKCLLDNIYENFISLNYGYGGYRYGEYRLMNDDYSNADDYCVKYNICYRIIGSSDFDKIAGKEYNKKEIDTDLDDYQKNKKVNTYTNGYPDMYMNTNFVLK